MGELIYTLSEELKKDQRWLVVSVEEERGTKRMLYKDVLLALAQDKDRKALDYLMKEELHFLGLHSLSQQVGTLPFNRMRVVAHRSNEALRLLALTGRLFWQGKRIIVDPFERLEFYYEAYFQENGELLVEGKWKGKTGPADWIFPGEPIWALREGVLQFLGADIDWKWMDQGSRYLEGAKREQFLDQFEDGDYPRAPKVIWNRSSQPSVATQKKVFPFLILQDRSGGFATLWFNYETDGTVASHDPKIAAWRDVQAEKAWEADLLETDFIRKTVGSSHYYCPLDKVAKSLTFLIEVGWTIYDAQKRRVYRQTEERLSLSMEKEHIVIGGKISYETHEADVSCLVGAFNRKERFIDLSPDSVGLIDGEKIEAELGHVELLGSSATIKKSHFGTLEKLFGQENIRCDPLVDRLRRASLPELALPHSAFCATLYPYQQEGLNWLSFLYASGLHGLLADEMGLGKTVQVLAFLSRLESSLPTVVIAPTSLLFHWRKEIEKFLPGKKVYVHSGEKRSEELDFLKQQTIVLTSYALVRQDIDLLAKLDWEVVILDEAQNIKNPDSLAAQYVRTLNGKFRLAMTGTPVENRSDDLWSLFAFLLPELLGERRLFTAAVEAASLDERHLRRLKQKLRPFLLQRRKEDVALQLPQKVEQLVWVEMGESQTALYESWMAAHKRGLLKKIQEEGAAAHRMEILEAILRLRQLCAAPQLVDKAQTTASAKLERLLSDLEEVMEEGRKVLIYSQFTAMLRLIAQEIDARGWRYVLLDGSTKHREEVVTAFQEDTEIPIFLISLKAGGVGLNLTAADYVFLYDPWWNEAVENQAIDRAHRVGRRSTVIARRYLTASTIEEKMIKLKARKSALAQGLLSFEESLQELSLEELCALLI